jgi:hypothetical protein
MMRRPQEWRLGRGLLALSLIFYLALGCSSAWGAERVFDAQLSLTGACQEPPPKLDPVLDPGCPGGMHPGPFVEPAAVTVDSAGDIFVSSRGTEETGRRIDVFSPAGVYISGFVPPLTPSSLAVDSKGNLYVNESTIGKAVVSRYKPTVYNPVSHEIEYPATPAATVIDTTEGSLYLSGGAGLAIDPENDDLFIDLQVHVSLYSSAAAGNELLDATIGKGLFYSQKIALDGTQRRLYASDTEAPGYKVDLIRVYEANPPYELLATIDGSETPAGSFKGESGLQGIAVDEEDGSFFVDDIAAGQSVYEFDAGYGYVSTYKHGFQNFLPEIEVDNAVSSPNHGTLFVPSVKEGGHVFVFRIKEAGPPELTETGVDEVTAEEAELHASINPQGLESEYRFEYVTQQQFEESGFTEALVAGEGTLPVGKESIELSVAATDLKPGTAYRFRAFAENEEGHDEEEGAFTTYKAVSPLPPCENDSLRTGPSAALPDCRAYELVTPPSTNGAVPVGINAGQRALTREASPGGDKVSFLANGASLPGFEGTGSFFGDPYLATRGPNGWTTASAGPGGAETEKIQAGTVSPDQGHSFWNTEAGDEGSASIEGLATNYVRYPDGKSVLVGRGSLGTDPRAFGLFMSEGGTHIVFAGNAKQLEPDAAPSGTFTIYDRTPDEITHVVSLLPDNVTPGKDINIAYAGASPDGRGIAFEVGGVLYLRLDHTETYEIGKDVTFAGIAEGGDRIFYVEGGDLFSFDAGTGKRTAFSESGDDTVVNVAAHGTAAYFVSPSVLTGEEENPNGAKAQPGKENLYLTDEGLLRFVATVTETDVFEGDAQHRHGLGEWTHDVGSGALAVDPSRTTPDGGVLLFESRAQLAAYDPADHVEVYRYDAGADELTCLSCSPPHTAAHGDASLESLRINGNDEASFGVWGYVPNLRSDGNRAFFQTPEPLVLADTDRLQDVYEWEANGVGSCEEAGGCIYLISSGASAHNDFLYAVSDSGDDVFFRTRDLLTGSDLETTTSIYDARVGGGFPEEPQAVCQGEGCRPQLTAPPPFPAPATGLQGADGNISRPGVKRCPKGKHKVERRGKHRCVKKHRKHHRRENHK